MIASGKFNTPVLFIIFNRPDPTLKVFEQIRKAKPVKLYIAADGPRNHKQGEKEKCERTRQVINLIDWDCQIKTLLRENNLGCRIAVSSAISWFFENEEDGIILEDDCIPNQSFFLFCQELLYKYKDNYNVMHIGGNNFLSNMQSDFSYYFSRYNHIWGWATWRRAWAKYDVDIKDLPDFIHENKARKYFDSSLFQYSWLYKFLKVYQNKIDTWDYQWTYTIWNNNGVCVTPTQNLVSNIGFDMDATHTKSVNNRVSRIKTEEINKIIHPEAIEINCMADNIAERIVYHSTFIKRIIFCIIIKFTKLGLHP